MKRSNQTEKLILEIDMSRAKILRPGLEYSKLMSSLPSVTQSRDLEKDSNMAIPKNGSTETQTSAPSPKLASKDEMRKLFASYDKADAEVDSLTAKLEEAKRRRGATIEAIVTGAGGKKGPFRHPTTNLVLSAVERKDKTGEGPSTWYFKGPSESDVIEV